MKRHRFLFRLACTLCAVVLLAGTATLECAPASMVRVHAAEAAASGVQLRDALAVAGQTVGAVPYTAEATWNELRGIVTYAAGGDPTAGKRPDEPGQNTKNNVAISLVWLFRSLKNVYSMRCVLEPYADADNVYEMCAYVRRLGQKGEECIHTGWLYDRTNRRISTQDGTGMMGIGYDFNYEFNTFSAARDPWQRNFGFCRLYDGSAYLIGDVYKTIRVPFRYDGKDWLIQIWKGVYSWNMLGGEVGLYNKPVDRTADFYDCATDPERLPMAFSVSLDGETIVQTDLSPSWWQTAFTQHRLALPRALTMEFSLTFPNRTMLRAFRDSLQQQAPDVTIRQDGLTLYCVWQGQA